MLTLKAVMDPDDAQTRQLIRDRADQEPRLLVSNEALVGWQPHRFEEAADLNLALWGEDATIVLTLRDPIEFQTSLYADAFRGGIYRTPQDFFLAGEQFERVRPFCHHWIEDFFSVDHFDLEHLLALYRARFRKVVALPYETLFDMHGLARLFGLSEEQRAALAANTASAPRLNQRASAAEMKLHAIYAKLTRQHGLNAGLAEGQRWRIAMMGGPQSHRRAPLIDSRRWLARLAKLSNRIIPRKPYALPGNVYANAELTQKNLALLADLVSQERDA
ncbi:MAG: hypothetical protein AAFR64_11570 [Pseudomonadota bacterium]